MAKEKTTKDLSQLAALLNEAGVELKQNSKEQKTQSKSTKTPVKKENKKQKKQPKPQKTAEEKARPTNGKELFELAMQMRKSGKQFDFSNKELALIYDYMVDAGITNGLTKAIEDILNRKGAQLVENPYKQLSSKTPEKYQWDFVNDGHAISWLQDYLDDNHKDEDGKYNSKAQKLLKMINNQRRRIGADDIEWNFRYNSSNESKYSAFVFSELLQKMQNKDETVADDISALGPKNLKVLHDNLSESRIEQENDEMKGIYRSIRSLIEAELRVRRNERAQQKKERKSQNNQTSLENTSAAAETAEPVAAEAVEETPAETAEPVAAEATEETPVETAEPVAEVEQESVTVETAEPVAAEAIEETPVETAEPVAAEAVEETPAETAEPTESEAAKDNQEGNENNVLITPHYVNASQDFFALSEEKQKEQINRMTAKDLVDWYDELSRSMYGTAEYIPTAQQKDAFYNMAFLRVCELSGNVNEKTVDEEDLQEITNLLAAYNVDFRGREVDVMKSPYFVIQLQAKTQALATRFPQEAENESPQIIGLNENSSDTENIDDTYPTDEEPVEFNEGNEEELSFEERYLQESFDIDYEYDDERGWTEQENEQWKQIENFFENVHIEYDDEWHKDMAVRMARQKMDISEAEKPYSKEEMRQHVYQLAKEAAIQQVLEKHNGALPDIDSSLVHEIRQAVLDQRQAICISMLEAQISRDLANVAKREKDANSGEVTTKEKAKRRAQEIYDNLSAPRYKNAWQRIARASRNLLGIASGQSVILQDSTIVSTIATRSVQIKAKAAELIDKFKETPVGKLFVKSKQRLDAFEAKLAKEHKYMNAVYTSAKMFTAGAVIGAVGGPVATAAWIGYNVAKADKAFYNEYLKAKQTGEIKNFGQFLKKNPLQSGLTIASNVGAVIGLNNAAAGGAVRMATGAAGVFTSAAKDFAKGDWRMGLTKIVTFGAGYAVGNSMHSSDANTVQNSEQTQQASLDAGAKIGASAFNNIEQPVVTAEPAAEEATELAEVTENTAAQPENHSTTQAKVHHQAQIRTEVQHNNATIAISEESNPVIINNQVDSTIDAAYEQQIEPLSEVMIEEDVQTVATYVEQPPHAPALDENGKITLLDGTLPAGKNGENLIHVTIEQSNNGVIETEVDAQGNVASQRAMLIDENGNKHAIITENEQTRYMTPAEEKHFIHNISVQHPVQEADANTAKLLNEIHGKPDIRDAEYKQWLAEHPERDDVAPKQDDTAPKQDDAALKQDDAALKQDDAAPKQDDATLMRSEQSPVEQDVEAVYSDNNCKIYHPEDGFVLEENGETIKIAKIDDNHVSWIKIDASGQQVELKGAAVDEAYSKIYNHLSDNNGKAQELQQLKLTHDTEQSQKLTAFSDEAVRMARAEIDAGIEKEKIGEEISHKAETILHENNQNETYTINGHEYASNDVMRFADVISDMDMSKVSDTLYRSDNAMMLSTENKSGEFVLFTIENDQAHFYEVHDGKPVEVGQERAEQLFDKIADEINNSHTKRWYDNGYQEEHAQFVSNAEQLNKFMLVRGFENAENLQHFSHMAALENVKLDSLSMQTFVAEDLSSATTVAKDGIVVNQKDGTETFVKYDENTQKLIAKTGPSYERHNLSEEEMKIFLDKNKEVFMKAGLQNSEFARAAYGDNIDTSVKLTDIIKVNQSVGLEDGQVREDGNQIVTISNNGFSICSNNESIAMVVKDGQIQGYHIDANGHQTAMSQSELHRQYQAAASQLRGTDYQNSEFAKVAHNTFQPNQHTRG